MTAAIIVLICIILFVILTYNSLVSGRQNIKEAWSTVNTQLKRRYDLIPNLVEVVKGYAKHEKETLSAVVAARSAAMSAKGVDGKNAEENALLNGERGQTPFTPAVSILIQLNKQFNKLNKNI